ncbi:MAG: hypothetical protein CME32_11570 [Gimesia sp.]|nr:hypothetical protein [Gimesia sp.]
MQTFFVWFPASSKIAYSQLLHIFINLMAIVLKISGDYFSDFQPVNLKPGVLFQKRKLNYQRKSEH